ncbi:PGRS repeat-containing protein, partial [Mycobacterium sp. UM_Kg1]|uniref:PGRS repeat-containing protein n=1 Tax=Mycobacterium sp. UM_Kg1 TaxID=1545691 RepID=UPI00061ACAA1
MRTRVVGLTACTGALLTFGMGPLAAAPAAHADFFDPMTDQLLEPFLDATTGAPDWDALFSPDAWETFLSPDHWDAALSALSGAALAGPAVDPNTWLLQYLYTPIHAGLDEAVNSDLGQLLLSVVNQPSLLLTGRPLIGDGVDGTADAPNGGHGGWLFGDGGDGWDNTESGGMGGAGGNAGMIGNGGDGGCLLYTS